MDFKKKPRVIDINAPQPAKARQNMRDAYANYTTIKKSTQAPTPTPAQQPQQPAQSQNVAQSPEISELKTSPASSIKSKGRFGLHLPHFSKKQWALFSLVLVLLIGAGGFVYVRYGKKTKAPIAKTQNTVIAPTPTPSPTTVASKLSGLMVSPEVNSLPVTAVIIENSPDARPQSGLPQASVVYEAIAEGGITRFVALYQDQKASRLGPVRSVRPYYIDWLAPYDAGVAHVGGSLDALAIVRSGEFVDLDQFFNASTYDRIKERYAPHNVYTSIDRLIALQKEKGHTSSTFTGFPRKADSPSATPTAKSIDLSISGYYYDVHYDYNPATNSYLRSEGGKPHIDEPSGQQLKPKVVVAIAVPNNVVNSSDGWRMEYNTIGSGSAVIFQDGTSINATWKKTGRKDRLLLLDANGKEIELNAGQTWITALSAISDAKSK